MASQDLNLILAALFELRLTCLENERTWNRIGNVAEQLGGDRTAAFFGSPAPDRGAGRTPCGGGVDPSVALDEICRLSGQVELTKRERNLILRGLFELTSTFAEDDDLRGEAQALAQTLGGDPAAMFFGAAPLRAS